jgi:hypothetical protein
MTQNALCQLVGLGIGGIVGNSARRNSGLFGYGFGSVLLTFWNSAILAGFQISVLIAKMFPDRLLPADVKHATELRGSGFNWATLAQLNRPTLWSFAIVQLLPNCSSVC